MPKRSTSDQRIVRRIFEALKQAGDEVLESQELNERGLAAPREIDVVLRKTVFGVPVTIAVEVRGRGRKATLQWLDELVGKYADMSVNKIIAISTTGFSKAALSKAASKGIEALTLTDAATIDWPAQFTKLGVARVVRTDRPESIHLVTEPPLVEPVNLDWRVGTETETMCTLEETARSVYRTSQEGMSKRFGELVPSLTLADLPTKIAIFEIPVTPANPTYLHIPDGTRVRITQMVIRVASRFSVDTQAVHHLILGEQPIGLASKCTMEAADGERVAITCVQVPDRPNEARVFFDSGDPQKRG